MLEIHLTTACVLVAGCEGWNEIEAFGSTRVEFLRQYLPYTNGVPSDDTLCRFFCTLDPKQFQRCCQLWLSMPEGTQIAIDGKTLRGSLDCARKVLHLVCTFASEIRIVLGKRAVSEKFDEITAIPEQLDLKGVTVSFDAMGFQYGIARQIMEGGTSNILGLQGNQPGLFDNATTFLENPPEGSELHSDEQYDKGHGRVETRWAVCYVQLVWRHEKNHFCVGNKKS